MKMVRINFKKIFIIYIIAAIIVGVSSLSFLAYQFREKIIFAYEYNKVSEKVAHNRGGIDAVKSELAKLANKSIDIVDILVLDSENKITFSVNNSEFAKSGNLELVASTNRENRFLTDKTNPNIYFRLVKNDRMMISKAMFGKENEIKRGYYDDYFYENNFSEKKVYLLSYIADTASDNKIYFISDIKPIANAKLYIRAVGALVMLLFMFYWVLIALWVYQNASKSKLNSTVWGIITLFTNLAGLLVYLIYKQNSLTCFKCDAVQSNTNNFCTYCGSKLGKTCDNCDSPVNSKDKYCKKCGSEICK